MSQALREAMGELLAQVVPLDHLRDEIAQWVARYDQLAGDHAQQLEALLAARLAEHEAQDRLAAAERQLRLEKELQDRLNGFHEAFTTLQNLNTSFQALHSELGSVQRERQEIGGALELGAKGLVTQAEWLHRHAFVMAFLPRLPQKVPYAELCLLFGGVALPPYQVPFVPPSEACTQIKCAQWAYLTDEQRANIVRLCQSVSREYGIELHERAKRVMQTHQRSPGV